MRTLQTPCFILDKHELQRSIRDFKHALDKNFKQSIIGYSVKTNSLPYAMAIAGNLGCYAEVVSYDEYELAKATGYKNSNIIYNGPMKSKETFIEAIVEGAVVNIETHRELEWILQLPNDKQYNVGIRLNINISHVSPEDADGDNDNSRFGFSDGTEEFNDAIRTIEQLPNVRLAGLHIHRTAHNRSVHFYKNSIRYACETIKKYNLKLDYLDIGGGYFGIFPNKPTYQQYSDVFHEVLREFGLQELKIIVEPGNALVASCFSFVSEVIDVKHVEANRWFITTDGSRNDIDPFFRKSDYLKEIEYKKSSKPVEEQIISGCTCLEYDRLFTLKDKPLLSVGDRIIYNNVGAYTMCLSPLFIRYIPKAYIKEEDKFSIIREAWGADEYLQKSVIRSR